MKKSIFTLVIAATCCLFMLPNTSKAQSCPWAKKAGGSYDDGGSAVATDGSGNVYATGYFYSTTIVFGTTTLHNSNTTSGGQCMYLAKYDSCGNVLWAKVAGDINGGSTYPAGLVTDASGNVYVAGYYNDELIMGTYTLTSAGTSAFVAKYSSGGVVQWAVTSSGNNQEKAYGIAVDGSNNVYVTGYFNSTTITFGSNNASNGTNDGFTNDAFIAKFDNSGNNLWIAGNTSNTSTDGDVLGYGIGTDALGNAYVCGYFESSNIVFGSTTLTNNGYNDIFVVKYSTSGAFQWLKTAGATDDDEANGIAVDAAGNSYITGRFGAGSTITFGSSTITNAAQNPTVLIAKYDASGNPQWANVSVGDHYSFNAGNGISLDAGGNPLIIGLYSSDSLLFGPVTLYNTSLLNGSGGGDYEYDVFAAKYKANGTLSWARTAGGDSNDVGNGIAAGIHNSLYITGQFYSPTMSVAGTTFSLSTGSLSQTGDAFIANNISTSPVTPSICMVTVDSLSINNIVFWDNTYPTAATYVIYREVSTNIYKVIGSQPYNALSQFIDTSRSVGPSNGNPNVGSYRYKLQIIDTAGTGSALSPYHNTIYITQGTNGTFSWATNYTIEGMTSAPDSIYVLACDTANTNSWTTVAIQAGTQQQIADPGFIHHASVANWRVDALGFHCFPATARLSGNNSVDAAKVKSHSNTNNNRVAGISKVTGVNQQVSVYPNPNNGSFVVETNATEKQTVQIYDVTGKLVLTQSLSGKTNIDAGSLNEGVYNISITGSEGVVNKRMVIVR